METRSEGNVDQEYRGADTLPYAKGAFEDRGYSVTRREIEAYTLQDLQREPLRYLDDFPQQGFTFAKYRDQVLDVELDGQRWECFGESRFGPLCVDAHGAVTVLVISTDGFGDEARDEFRPVNASLAAFVESYCTFMSMLFELRALLYNLDGDQQTSDVFARFEPELLGRLAVADETAPAAGGMWDALAYGISDGLFFVTASAHDFMADGRVTFIG